MSSTTSGPFSAGAQVSLRQYVREGNEPTCRELGLGEIVRPLRVGGRLEIRIRGERGLLSSQIRELTIVQDGRLAVVTNGRVYLLSRIDGQRDASETVILMASVSEMLDAHPERPDDEHTQYVRVGTGLAEPSVHPLVGVPVTVRRWPSSGDPKPQELGVGELLGEPQIGQPLRFRDGEGFVIATTDVTGIECEDGAILEVLTGSRRYSFELD